MTVCLVTGGGEGRALARGVPRFEGHVHSAASPLPSRRRMVVDSVGGCARSGPRLANLVGRGGRCRCTAEQPSSSVDATARLLQNPSLLLSPSLHPLSLSLSRVSLGQRPPRANAPTTLSTRSLSLVPPPRTVLPLSPPLLLLLRSFSRGSRSAVCLHRCRTFNRDRFSNRPVPSRSVRRFVGETTMKGSRSRTVQGNRDRCDDDERMWLWWWLLLWW